MMMAKMKRASTPDEAEMVWTALLMSAISSGELFGTFHWLQDCCMIGMLKLNMVSKSNHWLIAGQPASTVPLPEYIL